MIEVTGHRPGGLLEIQAHGTDAVSFQALDSGMSWWRDDASSVGPGAALAFVDTGWSWIAVGTPLVGVPLRAAAVKRFTEAARAVNRRAVFFGVENLEPFENYHRLALGLQSVLVPSAWPATLRGSRKLREQLRRARAKGVVVRIVHASELAEGAPIRCAVERLAEQWLASRHMEPLGFLVAVEPFHAPEEHLYLVAERNGNAVQFLSVVPIYNRNGWLFEHMLRGPDAPNGTTELLVDRVMRELQGRTHLVTPGLTPLAGVMPWWLRLARSVTAPLYDFAGLRRFRSRLAPSRWDQVWLVWDRGASPLVVLDVLRVFATGRLTAFAWRSLVRHPNGPPWAVAVPLVLWTMLLAVLATSGRAALLGFSSSGLWGWILFDMMLASWLFRAARRPRMRILVVLAACAACDALISIQHLATVGLGDHALSIAFRLLATAGPILGTTALAWAAYRLSVRPA